MFFFVISLSSVHRILLVAVAIFSLYSVHLLLKTANEGGESVRKSFISTSPMASRSLFGMLTLLLFACSLLQGALVYEQLGYKAFGMPGKLAASCSITMHNIGGERLRRF